MLREDGTFVTCVCGKRCYTEKEAGRILNMKSRHYRKSRTGVIPKRKYKCEECGWYHVTHSNQMRSYKWYKAKKMSN